MSGLRSGEGRARTDFAPKTSREKQRKERKSVVFDWIRRQKTKKRRGKPKIAYPAFAYSFLVGNKITFLHVLVSHSGLNQALEQVSRGPKESHHIELHTHSQYLLFNIMCS